MVRPRRGASDARHRIGTVSPGAADRVEIFCDSP